MFTWSPWIGLWKLGAELWLWRYVIDNSNPCWFQSLLQELGRRSNRTGKYNAVGPGLCFCLCRRISAEITILTICSSRRVLMESSHLNLETAVLMNSSIGIVPMLLGWTQIHNLTAESSQTEQDDNRGRAGSVGVCGCLFWLIFS